MDSSFRLKHVWPSVLSLAAGANLVTGNKVNIIIGIGALCMNIWIVVENVKDEK